MDRFITLGTPHQGASLERAGRAVDLGLEATPFTAPLARVGGIRSAGITDLRHGTVTDGPAEERPLPEGVAGYAVAATRAARRGPAADAWGDGLVSVASALAEGEAGPFAFHPERREVVYRTGHLGLLDHPGVARRLAMWLGAGVPEGHDPPDR